MEPKREDSFDIISPAEYLYLSNLIVGDQTELIKLTIQDLCIKQVLKLENRYLQIDSKHDRMRARLHFCRGQKFIGYTTYSKAEQFFLQLFDDNEERRLYHIRHHIKNKLSKTSASFDNLVFRDLKRKKLCYLWIIPSLKAWRLRKRIQQEIKYLNSNLDHLLEKAPALLNAKVEELGSHVLLLEAEHLERLSKEASLLDKVPFINLLGDQFRSGLVVGLGGASFGFSGGGFSGGGFSGGFGGFGGGSFGGGGASGSW